MEIWKKMYVKIYFGQTTAHRQTVYFRDELSFELFQKWKWYFEYRAALLRVQNPKCCIELHYGSYDYIPDAQARAKRTKDILTARKAKYTKAHNQLCNIRNNHNSLFPIEDDKYYIEALKKVHQLKMEIRQLEQECQNQQ